jgi:hypothetical protein
MAGRMRDHDQHRNNWFDGPGIFWGIDARWFERPDPFDETPPSARYRTAPPAPVRRSRWSKLVAWLGRIKQHAQSIV